MHGLHDAYVYDMHAVAGADAGMLDVHVSRTKQVNFAVHRALTSKMCCNSDLSLPVVGDISFAEAAALKDDNGGRSPRFGFSRVRSMLSGYDLVREEHPWLKVGERTLLFVFV